MRADAATDNGEGLRQDRPPDAEPADDGDGLPEDHPVEVAEDHPVEVAAAQEQFPAAPGAGG